MSTNQLLSYVQCSEHRPSRITPPSRPGSSTTTHTPPDHPALPPHPLPSGSMNLWPQPLFTTPLNAKSIERHPAHTFRQKHSQESQHPRYHQPKPASDVQRPTSHQRKLAHPLLDSIHRTQDGSFGDSRPDPSSPSLRHCRCHSYCHYSLHHEPPTSSTCSLHHLSALSVPPSAAPLLLPYLPQR